MKLILNLNGILIPINIEDEYAKYIRFGFINKSYTGYEAVENKPIYIVSNNGIKKKIYTGSKNDVKQYNNGNVYSNIKIALMNKKADTLFQKIRHWQALNDKSIDKVEWEQESDKFYFYYNYTKNQIEILSDCHYKTFGTIYFSSYEIAYKAMLEFHNDLMWYYTKYKQRLDSK